MLENLRCREVFSTIGVEGALLADTVSGSGGCCNSRERVVFESAAVLRGLTARLKGVDEFVGGLKLGWFVLLQGSGFADRLVERYCVKAMLQSNRGELDSRCVFFIDAGLSFDTYSVASLARMWRFSAAEALDRIIVARAFTCYELWSLIADLPRIVDRYGVQLIVVSGVFSLFASVDDVKQGEAEQILDFVRHRVTDVCRDRKVLCIATAGSSRIRGDERPFVSGRLLPGVDVLVEFRERNRRVCGSLLKHPSRSPVDFWVEPENRGDRLTLDSFHFQSQQQEVARVG